MKKLLSSLGWLGVLLPFMCIGIAHATLVTRMDDETRSVNDFKGIQVNGSFHVFVQIGNSESLRLEGNTETLKNVETLVENGTLKIRMKKNANWFNINTERVSVYINAKTVEELSQNGSGRIEVANLINSSVLETNVSGSGSITCQVKTNDFSASISGSGKINISGEANNNNIRISGSGKLDGAKLVTNNTQIKVSGSGGAYLTVNESLDANISGSGSVHYDGKATNVNARTSGSGKVKRM